MNTMTTDDILKAYEAQQTEEQALIESKNAKIRAIAESRQKAENRKEKIEEIKKKILEKREALKENKKTLKEENEYAIEGEGEEELPEDENLDEDELGDIDEEGDVEGEEGAEEEVVDPDDVEEIQKESKQSILKKIAERKKQDILKKIAERKAKAEAEQKTLTEKKEPVKEKKEVRVGTLLENAEGDKKRRFSVYREEKTHFFLKELGTGKTFKIAKEKVELS